MWHVDWHGGVSCKVTYGGPKTRCRVACCLAAVLIVPFPTRAGTCAVSPAKLAALSGPDVPPAREEVKRIIQRLQKKDIYGIFREPVTDEMVHSHPCCCAHSNPSFGAVWLYGARILPVAVGFGAVHVPGGACSARSANRGHSHACQAPQ